jgi:hypothetical protein
MSSGHTRNMKCVEIYDGDLVISIATESNESARGCPSGGRQGSRRGQVNGFNSLVDF